MPRTTSTRDALPSAAGMPAARMPSGARAIIREYRPYVIVAAIMPIVAALYWGQGVLIPVVLAGLFTFLLGPVVGALERAGLGRIRAGKVVAAVLVVAFVFSILGGAAWIIVQQVTALGAELPQYRGNIMRKVEQFRGLGRRGPLAQVQSTAKEVMGELQKEPVLAGESKPLPVVVKPDAIGIWQLPRLLQAGTGASFVIVLVIFMLIERREMRNRFIRLSGDRRLASVTRALDEASGRISRYLLMQSLLNVIYGAALGMGLFFIGVPYALLWAVLAFLLRFLPYVGPPLAAVGPLALSLAVFEGWQRPLATFALFAVVELVTYVLLEPLLYGQTIGVSPPALLISVAFWTWLWGPIGLVLGTPLTVCLVVFGKHIPALGFITVFMTDEPALACDVGYYQRLLARDEAEGLDILEAHCGRHALVEVYDDVVIPALSRARADREALRLSPEEASALYKSARSTVDEFAARRSATLPGAAASQGKGTGAVPVLACAAGDEADEIALAMLGRLLSRADCTFESVSAHVLSGEIVTLTAEKKPGLVLIAALAPGGLGQACHLCKRLRARFPGVKILVGRRGARIASEGDRSLLLAAGADAVGTSIGESCDQLLERVRLL